MTLGVMAMVTFRTDAFVDEALADLTSGDVDRSTVIREAILEMWDHRRRARLREESLRLANDPADRAEIEAVRADMDALAPDAW
jgi:Arc/MetJ-type ribon-helix-helix transcriptional regulator